MTAPFIKSSLSDYTEAEFLSFLLELRVANKSVADEGLDPLLNHFCTITKHPDGTDLFYYPENGADNSSEGVIGTLKKWRADNGLPGFKQK
jgi:hypothetical protein